MKTITSVHNEEIKAVAKLSTPKGRKEQQRFIAEGLRVCSTLSAAGYKPVQVYIIEDMLEPAKELVSQHSITLVDDAVLKKMSVAHTPSGILAVFAIPRKPALENLSTGIVLYEVSDPGNMGTLLRTCAAMGKKTVVVIDGVDPWSPKVVQASAGTIGLLNIFELTWQELNAAKKQHKLCALVVSGGQKPDEVEYSDILFVIGNEAHGVPEHVEEQCDYLITLAMPGAIESLNAAIAGSIAQYLAWHKG